ncbi:hypothetical protein PAECIP111893_02428 [Paenibacillus plantiphilus]|uniref:Uncharacterized protein n=1 Tax=Paenibacillus plantiphilus TaxID=2905650 RepID=A0ABN8GCN1_9BACL|nr:hypothetical protein [Paenibacillus plantiphilus]CAH1205817.1 hypothetical protein PAECIP111893_02428 [Paenibacillus plantiphilus]
MNNYEQSYVNYAKAQLDAAKTDDDKAIWNRNIAAAEREIAKQQLNYCID